MSIVSFLLGGKSQTSIGSITVDVILRKVENNPADVTNSPVEDGSTISDFVINQPQTLRIRGKISDTPLGQPFNLRGQIFTGQINNSISRQAYNDLLKLRNSKETFDIMTSRAIYTDMLFTDFNVIDDPNTGFAIEFIANCQQVLKAIARTIKVPRDKVKGTPPNAKDQQQSTVDKGTQQTQDGESSRGSVLNDLYEQFGKNNKYLRGAFGS